MKNKFSTPAKFAVVFFIVQIIHLQFLSKICATTFFPPVALRPNAGSALLILEVSRSHKRRITFGRTPLFQ